jgi:hypothetical protein
MDVTGGSSGGRMANRTAASNAAAVTGGGERPASGFVATVSFVPGSTTAAGTAAGAGSAMAGVGCTGTLIAGGSGSSGMGGSSTDCGADRRGPNCLPRQSGRSTSGRLSFFTGSATGATGNSAVSARASLFSGSARELVRSHTAATEVAARTTPAANAPAAPVGRASGACRKGRTRREAVQATGAGADDCPGSVGIYLQP